MSDDKKRDRPFAYVDAVSETKRDVIGSGELPESGYKPFIANRALSYHADAVLYANDMNMGSHLPARMQFDYYLEALRPRRRFSRWYKPEVDEAVEALSLACNYSKKRAREAVRVLRDDQIEYFNEITRGGTNVR